MSWLGKWPPRVKLFCLRTELCGGRMCALVTFVSAVLSTVPDTCEASNESYWTHIRAVVNAFGTWGPKAILKGIMDLLHLPLLLKSSKWWQTSNQFRALECIYLQTSWLCLLDAKQLNQLILVFPEWAGCVLFMKTESVECSRFSSVT